MLQLQYNIQLLLHSKYKFLFLLSIILLFYIILYNNNTISLCMIEEGIADEIKQSSTIEALQTQISELSYKNFQLQQDFNRLNTYTNEYINEICKLRVENSNLRHQISQLEVLLRETSANCSCNIL